MKKEQKRCEFCKYIKETNAKAEEERIKLKEIYDMNEKTLKIRKMIEREIKHIDCMFADWFKDTSAFMIAYKACCDNARFTFADFNNDNDDICMKSAYIQYCPYCGHKIKQ